MLAKFSWCGLLFFVLGLILLVSCTKSDPLEIVSDNGSNNQTPMSMDSMQMDTTCDTTDVSFSASIVPLIADHCLQCHSGDEPRGGVLLSNHASVKKEADSGRLYGSVSWQIGYETMPQGADKLPPCDLQNVKAWVDAGAPNN